MIHKDDTARGREGRGRGGREVMGPDETKKNMANDTKTRT